MGAFNPADREFDQTTADRDFALWIFFDGAGPNSRPAAPQRMTLNPKAFNP
jgi:hypothetical protein